MQSIAGVTTSTTAFVGRTRDGPAASPRAVDSFASFVRIFGGVWSEAPMTFAVQQFFDNGGSAAVVVRALAAGDILGSRAGKTGIYALLDAGIFNLLCLPPPAPNVEIDQATWTEAARFCQEHRAMLLVDAPDEAPAAVKTTGPALITDPAVRKNAALFYPRILIPNPLGASSAALKFVPCGAAAGVFSRIDSTRGVWKAPAGIDARLNAKGVSRLLGPPENGQLNSLGINCVRTFPGHGTVLWGARTMDGADAAASEWKYIPVRRTALFIEESVQRGLGWTVSERNAAALWAQVTLDVTSFMHDLFRQGAFMGATPRDAYFARCGVDTTTPADINNGVMNVMIGFAPLRPAEFVILRVSVSRV